MLYLASLLLFAMTLHSADSQPKAAQEKIRIVPVDPSPESESIILAIALPKTGEILKSNPVWAQIRVDGYPLGTGSGQTERSSDVAVSDMGQSIHVVIDNYPYFPVNGPSLAPFDENGFYYNSRYKFEIPFSLKEGMHTIRIFPARSFGESLKKENTYMASYFYLGSEKNNPDFSLEGPYLTYNEPSDQIPLTTKKPILLDFYLTNCELSTDGYKVRLTVDGSIRRTLTSWQPYYIYGLTKGTHTIRLELLNPSNKVVPGSFNSVQRTITVK